LAEGKPASVDDRLFDEWKEARGLISKLDDTLADLRKYGFSFITALLAADSVLGETSSGATISISPGVKLAIFVSTLILIAGLCATDRYFRTLQEGASARAIQIENHFKTVTLTHIVGKFYYQKRLWLFIEGLYVCFTLAAEVLALMVLRSSPGLMLLMTIAALVTILFVIFLPRAGGRPNLWPSAEV
jgi:hypothetical protein